MGRRFAEGVSALVGGFGDQYATNQSRQRYIDAMLRQADAANQRAEIEMMGKMDLAMMQGERRDARERDLIRAWEGLGYSPDQSLIMSRGGDPMMFPFPLPAKEADEGPGFFREVWDKLIGEPEVSMPQMPAKSDEESLTNMMRLWHDLATLATGDNDAGKRAILRAREQLMELPPEDRAVRLTDEIAKFRRLLTQQAHQSGPISNSKVKSEKAPSIVEDVWRQMLGAPGMPLSEPASSNEEAVQNLWQTWEDLARAAAGDDPRAKQDIFLAGERMLELPIQSRAIRLGDEIDKLRRLTRRRDVPNVTPPAPTPSQYSQPLGPMLPPSLRSTPIDLPFPLDPLVAPNTGSRLGPDPPSRSAEDAIMRLLSSKGGTGR